LTETLPPLPRIAALRWLIDAGPDVSMEVRSILIAEMVGSRTAAFAGPINALLFDIVALCLHGGRAFACFLALEGILFGGRFAVMRRSADNAARGHATPPDLYLLLAIGWCALQGAAAFTAMASGNTTLQIVAALSFMALVGPICARNYGAPRFAMLLLGLICVPLASGAQCAGNPYLLIMMVQLPLLLMGASAIIQRFHSLALTALLARERSQHLALHDSLTGLLNRAGLAGELTTVDAARGAVTVLYLDLDGFKTVNDALGHPAGDLLLVAVADRLRTCTRKGDIVARLGGDEFVIVASGLPQYEAARVAERIVQHIASRPFTLGSNGMARVGVSVGFACAPDDGVTLDELTRKADIALYDAKGAGKGVSRRYRPAPAQAIAC
jgi:diguanylate cyclase (GGDEF)-like protein